MPRLVYEIESQPAVCVGAQPYSKLVWEAKARAVKVSLSFIIERQDDICRQGEEINIEGNAAHILSAMEEACEAIRLCVDSHVKDGFVVENWQDSPPMPPKPKGFVVGKSKPLGKSLGAMPPKHQCKSETRDNLAGKKTRCIRTIGHNGPHEDGCMSWGPKVRSRTK